MDSFLEREKELLRLNETLNQKCAITLAARTKVTKVNKNTTTATKMIKNVKSKSDATKINSFALADANKQSNGNKVVADDSNDNCNANEDNQLPTDASKDENINATNASSDNRDPIEKFLDDFTVASKIKLTDAQREPSDATAANENAKSTNGMSLIPNNLVRRNVSTDGIIR